jgi:uncharacterized membrane protein YjfL (UPF0719 family)
MEFAERYFTTEGIQFLFHGASALYVFVILIILYVGKIIYDYTTPFNLSEQLTTEDNKAVALSFAGFLAAVGFILWGVLSSPAEVRSLWGDIWNTMLWGLIGIVLMQIARWSCERFILYKFNLNKELVTDHNVGTGAVLAGVYAGSGLVIMGAISDDGSGLANTFMQDLVGTLVFFIFGQLAFILFGIIYQYIVRFDLHDEIERDNISAGVAFGMSVLAIGILLSGYIYYSWSLPGLFIWFILSTIMLMMFRYLVDKLILPGTLLDEEIARDQNWGAALLEGSMAIILALILNAAFLYDLI